MANKHRKWVRFCWCDKVRLALALAAIALPTAARPAGTDQDFDLACAVTAAAEIATAQRGSEQQNAALEINVYFIGRLSGRDPNTYWSAVVKGKLAELRSKAKNSTFFSTCMDFFTKQL